jgi:tetratricopeptide (TPR) repeat protein
MPLQTDTTLAKRRLAHAIWKAEHNHFDAARQLFEEALQLNPADTAARLAYAAFLARQEDWVAAKQELEQAIRADSAGVAEWLKYEVAQTRGDTALIYLTALLETHLGHYEEAYAAYKHLLDVVPGQGQFLVDQAILWEKMNQWDAAARNYQAALQIDADNVPWLMAYGLFLEQQGRDGDALRVLKWGLELNPGDVDLRERVEQLDRRANREVEARKQAAWAQFVLEEQGNVDEAAALVAEALRQAPDCATAHRVQSRILVSKGFLFQAAIHLARAMELEPDNPQYQADQQSLQAEIHLRRQRIQPIISQARTAYDPALAAALLDQALDLIADDVDTHVAYAGLLWPDRPDEVEKHLQSMPIHNMPCCCANRDGFWRRNSTLRWP